MANPVPGDVHVNTPLTNISIAYMQNAKNFVATGVFPNIPVKKQSDRYYTYDRGEFNRDEMKKRAPGTETAGGGYTVDNTPTYYAHVWGYHKDVDDQMRANADSVIRPDKEATQYVSQISLIRQEKQFATNFLATSIWTTDITGVSGASSGNNRKQWNDDASTPLEDIEEGRQVISQSTGFEPNTLVIGSEVWSKLKNHPDIVDRIKYGQTAPGVAVASVQAFSDLIEVPRIFIMKSIENTAAEGATNAHSFIGGKVCLLCYSASDPGLMTPSAGYTFSWTGYLGATDRGSRIKRYRMEALGSDRVEIETAFDMKLIAADLGYYFTTIVA